MSILTRFADSARSRLIQWLQDGTMQLEAQKQESVRQNMIALARRYYAGDHVTYLTPRQQEWLDLHPGSGLMFVFNHCETIVDVVVERLRVTGFKSAEGGGESLVTQLWDWWQRNRMDALQVDVHRAAVRDGEAFLLVSWDTAQDAPTFVLHPRYVSKQQGGDGFGMYMVYPDNNVNLPAIMAVKLFDELFEGSVRSRKTEYYPDRVEKYVLEKGKWVPLQDEGDTAWPIDLTGPTGLPMGIPVAHFRAPNCTSDLKVAIPIQDAMNKLWLDIMAAADASSFRTMVTFGWRPTKDGLEPREDGSNLVRVSPGNIISTLKPATHASLQVIEPGNVTGLLELEERLVITLARVTDTPAARFQTTRQIAAEGTLKQQEAPLIAKVEERQTLFGNAWEDAMKVALGMAQIYGSQVVRVAGAVPVFLSVQWKSPEVREDKEKAEVAEKQKGIGVPFKYLLRYLGFSPDEIEEIMNDPEVAQRMKNMALAGQMLEAQAEGAGSSNDGNFPNRPGGNE